MSLIAERSVIGSLIMDKSGMAKVSQVLSPEMFTDEFLGRVYFVLKQAFENNTDMDEIALARKLADPVRSERDVGVELADIVQSQFRFESVEAYADMVICDYRAKKANEILNKIQITGETVNKDIRDVTASLEALLGDGQSNESTVPEIAEQYKDEYFHEDEKPRVKIGFKGFDEEIHLTGGNVMAIGARPKTGKSALALQIAIYLQNSGLKVGYFNLEMTRKQLFERMTAFTGFLDLNRILNGTRFLEGEKEKFDKAIDTMRGMKNLTILSGSKSVSDIRAESRGKGFDVIIIDYLQLLKSEGKRGANRYAEVGDISRGIKAIAMDYNIPVIILSQLNRESALSKDKEPSAANFRESGDIEQDVSIALILWSPEENNDTKRMLKIELNRQGRRKRGELFFEGKHMRFYETDKEGNPIYPKEKYKEGGFLDVDIESEIPFE